MASFNLTDISSALSGMKDVGVSFVGKALKFNNAADAAELIDAIQKCPKLNCLNLEGNSLGVEAAKCIGEALKSHPELERALFKDLFTGRMKDEIPVALESMGEGMRFAYAKLTVFDCSDNALGPNGMKGLVELFRSSTCYTLQELRLNNCGLGIQGAKMLAQSLLGCHTKSVEVGTPFALKVFIAGRNRLENEGAKALAEVFAAIKSLEQLSIPQNGIYHPGITALSNALKENPNLSILNFNDNTIGPKGALALSEALYSVQKLREMNLGDCLLKTRGAVLIAEAIQDTHLELEAVNLEHNEIGPHGGMSLASAMYNKANLQSLNINGNQFGEEGRVQIQEIMGDCDKAKALEAMDEDESESENEEENGEEELEDEEEEYDEDGEEEEDEEDDDENDDDDEDEIDESELVIEVKKPLFAGNDTTLENSLNISVKDDEPPSNAIEAFCTTNFPSESLFYSIEDSDKVAAFRSFLKNDVVASDYFMCLAFAILKCSELSEKSKDALTLAEALYKDAFEYAKNNNRMKALRDFILIQLGLLKSEDKTFTPKYNIKACRYALQQAVAHNCIPKDEQNTFNVFIEQVNGK